MFITFKLYRVKVCLRLLFRLLPAGISFTRSSKHRFSIPHERQVVPINEKFAKGKIPLPNFTFIKEEKFVIFPINLSLGRRTVLHDFYEILSSCACPRVAFVLLIWSNSVDSQPSCQHLPTMGVYSHEFSTAPSIQTNLSLRQIWLRSYVGR